MPISQPPLDTPDQRWVERLALRILGDRSLAVVGESVAQHWIAQITPDEAQLGQFELELERAVFCGLMNTANADPRRPLIHAFGRLEHEVDGKTVPATRTAHTNLDYVYRFVPLDGASSLHIRGRVHDGQAPLAIEYALLTAGQVYQKTLALADIAISSDGTFDIYVDGEEAGDRQNHFQVDQDSYQLLLRDVIGDPRSQLPLDLEIVRAAPLPDPASIELPVLDATAQAHIQKHVDDLIFTTRNFAMAGLANQFGDPAINKTGIYSASQAYSIGHVRLDRDEAMIITLTLGSAAYATVPLTNIWGGVGEILAVRSNVSTPLATRNGDGSFTFVISLTDPGTYNWVEIGPDGTGCLFMRWVGLTDGVAPEMSASIVHLDNWRPPAELVRNGRPDGGKDLRREGYCRVMA